MKPTTSKSLACDELRNERHAHFAMQQNKEQVARDRIADRNARTRLDEQLRKERVNNEFWIHIRQALTVIAIALIAYTLFHFAGVSRVA